MTLPTKILAPVLFAAIPLFTGSASAAPLSQALTLGKAETATVEQIQYYRRAPRHYGHYYGDRYYGDGYYAYGAAPGYIAPRRRAWNYGNGSAATGRGSAAICPSDRYQASGYPSWMCR
jgi:hypothetical protein